MVVDCQCGQQNCSCCQSRARARRMRCRRCPKCQNDFCQLKMEVGKEKKTCYQVEQKLVCIPAIRLPWKNCQPTCSRTRTVKVLKTHTYECSKCNYTWSVCEPEEQDPGSSNLSPGSSATGDQQIMQPAALQYEPITHETVPYEPTPYEIMPPHEAVPFETIERPGFESLSYPGEGAVDQSRN